MIRSVILMSLALSACSTSPPTFPICPHAPDAPAPAPKNPTPKQVGLLEIRVEQWAEHLLARGDACAAAVDVRDAWIRGRK